VERAWSPDTLQALQRVTDAALAHLSLDELLAELLLRITEILETDTAAFLLLDPGANELVATAAKGIEEEVERGVRIPVGRGFAGRIAARRQPIIIEDVDHADIMNPILRQRGIRSLLGVPLLVEGDVIGVLHVGTLTPRAFVAREAELLQLAADRAAMAIDHARMYENERQSLRRLEALQRVTDVALAYLPLDELLAELLQRMTEILNTNTAAFLLLDERANELVATAAKGIEEEVEQGVRIPLGRGFAGRIAAERHPIIIADVDHADIFNPILRQRGIRSLLGVPLLVEGQVIGVLHVGTLTPRKFTSTDAELLQLAADRAATAIERARSFHQRGVVETLQRSLVPEHLPGLPGLQLAARYRPAVRQAGIGGDWYDAFPLPRGGLALVVGDVMGHGIAAAALMAQMRTGLRAYALEGHPPAAVVERLNRLAVSFGSAHMTTLAYAMLDLEHERLTVVLAGHLPPILRGPGGETRVLGMEGDPPLGISPATAFHEYELDLPVGSSIVLVTDGAVEVRGESIERGLERLCDLVARADDLASVCEQIASGIVRGQPADDDVAVIAAGVRDLPERLQTTWPAASDTLPALRPLLRRWLHRWGAGDDEVYDITVAVVEAATNAVEHAYAPGRALFEVDAHHADGVVTVAIRDRGRWRAPRGTHRGRGLSMMRALMESVDVHQDERGTEVVLRRTLERQVA
jgi:serine phosphatase RsbU (regulator of sigma subunit)/putative methionine-R-sulfoxide reductase with GAF domain/anti-sigma regulatory factor (Ser/Thr protein kinase)